MRLIYILGIILSSFLFSCAEHHCGEVEMDKIAVQCSDGTLIYGANPSAIDNCAGHGFVDWWLCQ